MRIVLLTAILFLAGCDPAPRAMQADQRPLPSATGTTSYEVAIAIAAANRNRAFRECDDRSAPERNPCRAEIESQWDIAKAALEDLRGDQS